MRVVAIPNRRYPPPEDAVALARLVLASPRDLTVAAVADLDAASGPPSSSPRSA
jgi:hypothetical protein